MSAAIAPFADRCYLLALQAKAIGEGVMFKGARARERLFAGLMWLVSIVLAGFLIGLGSLVIADLPKVSHPVTIEQFIDPARQAALTRQAEALNRQSEAGQAKLKAADDQLSRASAAYGSAKETFDNWILTRTATSDRSQDPEVLARTRALDQLRAAEDSAQAARDAAQTDLTAIAGQISQNEAASTALQQAAQPQYERARFVEEMKVFALRLALTLPLLVISAWMLLRRRGGDYWPMMRGFILFSLFAFFVELAPYLPEYGGYVRYSVGVILTLVLGHYGIKGMRAYEGAGGGRGAIGAGAGEVRRIRRSAEEARREGLSWVRSDLARDRDAHRLLRPLRHASLQPLPDLSDPEIRLLPVLHDLRNPGGGRARARQIAGRRSCKPCPTSMPAAHPKRP
ncbi:MAG: hypothetical protein P4L73_05900 [Caulobacteraceae bacterium]|nr:hypothetical protein [Caulobacteraceae bacterium]